MTVVRAALASSDVLADAGDLYTVARRLPPRSPRRAAGRTKSAVGCAVKAFGRLIALDHSEPESQLDATAALDHVQFPGKPSSTA
jgi:hypothetical protein